MPTNSRLITKTHTESQQLTEQQFEDIVTKAIKKALPDQCRYHQYMQDSELTATKHMEDHRKFHSLFGTVGKMGNKIIMTIIALFTAGLIMVFGWGIVEAISKKLGGS